MKEAIKQFRGAKRRFQVFGEVNDILVIDDYAHHPTEIEATIMRGQIHRQTDHRGLPAAAVYAHVLPARTFSRAFPEADEVL